MLERQQRWELCMRLAKGSSSLKPSFANLARQVAFLTPRSRSTFCAYPCTSARQRKNPNFQSNSCVLQTVEKNHTQPGLPSWNQTVLVCFLLPFVGSPKTAARSRSSLKRTFGVWYRPATSVAGLLKLGVAVYIRRG